MRIATDTVIGAEYDMSGDFFNGTIDELRIANFSYSAEYVNASYSLSSVLSSESSVPTTVELESCDSPLSSLSKTISPLNETSPFESINATVNSYLSYTDTTYGSGTSNFTFTNNTYRICIWPPVANFTVSGQIQYSNSSYTTRDYYLDSETFDNTTSNFNLYMLPYSTATYVTLTVRDQYATVQPNVIIYVERYYPELNAYKIVAGPRTDSNGQAIVMLRLYDVYYRFVLQQNGEVIQTIPASFISDTSLQLNINPSTMIDWLRYYGKIYGYVNYTSTDGNITANYTDLFGYLQNATFIVTQVSAFGSSQICSKTNTSSNGTMVCHVGNATGRVIQYVLTGTLPNNGLYAIANGLLEEGVETTRILGNCASASDIANCTEGLFIVFWIVLICSIIGMTHPAISIATMLAGVVVTWAIGLIAITLQTVIGLIFVGGIIIYRMRD